MRASEFLRHVVTGEEGWLCIAYKQQNGQGWWEHWYEWPRQCLEIDWAVEAKREEYNVYFSSYLFSEKHRNRKYALGTRTIQADLDEADINKLPLQPYILVESSPGRHQGYWVLEREVELAEHEALSRKLTYAIPLCDHSGWPIGRVLRLPGSFNHKYMDGVKEVQVVRATLGMLDASDFEMLSNNTGSLQDEDALWADTFGQVWNVDVESETGTTESDFALDIGPQELLSSIKDKIPPKVYVQYNIRAQDRSAALWALMCAAFRAGLTREEVLWLSYNSANNKFKDLAFNGNRELAKDVLRAEKTISSPMIDPRMAVSDARKLSGPNHDKRLQITNIVYEYMNSGGKFFRGTDETIWYCRKDMGRPIQLAARSDYFDTMLDVQFGLNATEPEQSFTVNGLMSMCRDLPSTTNISTLSHSMPRENKVLIHTGRKDVLRVGPDSIETVVNGAYDVLFPWSAMNEPFIPSFDALPDGKPWYEFLFDPFMENILDMEPDQAMALLRTWMVFLLMRNEAVARPILAALGQPGSGKSTLFRVIYSVLYGKNMSLEGITTPEHFDHSCSVNPFVAFDNVDTWEPWLPDRLAMAISASGISKRKLYSDTDTIFITKNALVGINAHNPRFLREDVADRLLLITFKRLAHFRPEGVMIANVLRHRNKVWAGIIKDLQKVLSTSREVSDIGESPQFRVEDFARIGWRCAVAWGIEDSFSGMIGRTIKEQKSQTLEEQNILVSSLVVLGQRDPEKWWTPNNLFSALTAVCSNPGAFEHIYKNGVILSKRLMALQDSLKEIMRIEWKSDPGLATKVWRFQPIVTVSNNGISSNGNGGHTELSNITWRGNGNNG